MIRGESNVPICRVLNRDEDGSYIIQDIFYQKKKFKKEKLKQAIKQGQLNVIDLQVSKNNRLVKKKVDLKSVCVYQKGKRDNSLPILTVEDGQKILFYGLAYINSNMTEERKKKICTEIEDKEGIGVINTKVLTSLFTKNIWWTDNQFYWGLDMICRAKVIELLYDLVK